MKLISGPRHLDLACSVAKRLGISLTPLHVHSFPDTETLVEIGESVRGADVFCMQSIVPPVNESLMELFLILDALKRSSAGRITACIPYLGYARQDRMTKPRTSISAKLIADLLVTAGADRVLTVDLHKEQLQGFFSIPVDNLYAHPLFAEHITNQLIPGDTVLGEDVLSLNILKEQPIIVSPDAGGVVRARTLAERLGCELAVIDKRRDASGIARVMHVMGDVSGCRVVLLDDMIDSGRTLCEAANALLNAGAVSVSAYATHGVLSGDALERLRTSQLSQVVLTNSLPIQLAEETLPSVPSCRVKGAIESATSRVLTRVLSKECFKILSVASLLAQAIRHIHQGHSLSQILHDRDVPLDGEQALP
jgi:ribose-phosphate pyrophosphokinase